MEKQLLRPNGFYWARRPGTIAVEIVQVSTIFGSEIEFLTLAVIGTEEHFMLDEFELLEEIVAPAAARALKDEAVFDRAE